LSRCSGWEPERLHVGSNVGRTAPAEVGCRGRERALLSRTRQWRRLVHLFQSRLYLTSDMKEGFASLPQPALPQDPSLSPQASLRALSAAGKQPRAKHDTHYATVTLHSLPGLVRTPATCVIDRLTSTRSPPCRAAFPFSCCQSASLLCSSRIRLIIVF
jgi:hypothetical protein